MNARHDFFGMQLADSGRYRLEGELSFSSVEPALKQMAKFIAGPAKIVFDLAGIRKADSAGLALLLEWLRLADQEGVELNFVNLPQQLLAMAHVVGVDEILIIDQTLRANGFRPGLETEY